MDSSAVLLPGPEKAGQDDTWVIRCGVFGGTVAGQSRSRPCCPVPGDLTLMGRFLGVGSVRSWRHTHPGTSAAPGQTCAACRWFEPRIFRLANGPYVVHYTGASLVPGELYRYRHEVIQTPGEVLEALTTRRQMQAYLTVPAARALAQASTYDDDLLDVWENRAIR